MNKGLITGIIYKYTSPSNKVYIGQTTNEEQRKKNFKCKELYSGIKFDCARKKYGVSDNWKYEVISKKNYLNNEDASFDLDLLEVYYIAEYDSYNNGYNSTFGGDGSSGVIVSEETRKKKSEAVKGEKNPFYNRYHTKETKKKISETKKGTQVGNKNPFFGRKHTEESLRKIREAHLGKHPTEETRKKMSENRSISIIQLNIGNGIIKNWKSAKEASIELNIDRSAITKCCKGKLKTAGGYIWKYAE